MTDTFTIEEISDILHRRVQFYNALGEKDNGGVLRQIEEALAAELMGEEIEVRQ